MKLGRIYIRDDEHSSSFADTIKVIIFWVLVILAAFFIGKWLLHLIVDTYLWCKALIIGTYINIKNFFANLWYDIEDLFYTIVFAVCAVWIGNHSRGLSFFSKIFPHESGEDIKKRYSNNTGYLSQNDEPRYNHRALGDDGNYHTITTDKYGGNTRDEFGRNGSLHDHEFHR